MGVSLALVTPLTPLPSLSSVRSVFMCSASVPAGGLTAREERAAHKGPGGCGRLGHLALQSPLCQQETPPSGITAAPEARGAALACLPQVCRCVGPLPSWSLHPQLKT